MSGLIAQAVDEDEDGLGEKSSSSRDSGVENSTIAFDLIEAVVAAAAELDETLFEASR